MKVRKLKNGKAAGKDEVTGEMVKSGGDIVVDQIWRLCNMAFEIGVVLEYWRSAMIVPLYKVKGKRIECNKLYQRNQAVKCGWKNISGQTPQGLIDDEQRGFISGKGCVYKIFTLKIIGEKPREKK